MIGLIWSNQTCGEIYDTKIFVMVLSRDKKDNIVINTQSSAPSSFDGSETLGQSSHPQEDSFESTPGQSAFFLRPFAVNKDNNVLIATLQLQNQ